MLYFLIGFMGSGKSYTGRNISELLSIPIIDMDKYIEEKENRSIAEIFEKDGEPYFRKLERDFLENLDPNNNLIISTGGGAPCFFDNMELMNQKGMTIYLNRSKEVVMRQLLKGIDKRPLLKGKSEDEIWAFYDSKLSERKSFYEKAKIHAGDLGYVEIAQLLKSRKL
ncbi:MAG: shikimate kinase [Chitinophagales bacterium]|nr:shikimate kinase [Chitinophagales bacterium]